MVRRSFLIVLIGVLSALGVASATTLGAFDEVGIGAVNDAVDVCTAEATLLDASGLPITLGVATTLNVDAVRLTGLEGDCDGTIPVVVTIGERPIGAPDAVLDVLDLTGRETINGTANTELDVLASDSLHGLLDLLTVVTEVRVAFLPGN